LSSDGHQLVKNASDHWNASPVVLFGTPDIPVHSSLANIGANGETMITSSARDLSNCALELNQ
jgi:hypothetical protein